ncbi:MAG: hypothetical protein WD823_02005 [Sulfuricaulis sp.]
MDFKKGNKTEDKPVRPRPRFENVELLPRVENGQLRFSPVSTQDI